ERRTTSSERLIPLGEIVGTHGVGGLLRFHPYSDSAAVLSAPATVHLDRNPGRQRTSGVTAAGTALPRTATVTSVRPHGRVVLLRFQDVDTIEIAASYVGAVLSLPE